MDNFIAFITDWKALFGGVGAAVVAVIVSKLFKRKSNKSEDINQSVTGGKTNVQIGKIEGGVHIHPGMTIDVVNEIVQTIIKKEKKVIENRKDQQITDMGQRIKELESVVTAVSKQKGPGVDEALAELEKGETAKAEKLFEEIIKSKRQEGDAALKEAAAAARHLGALAFLHDTEKALGAYRQAVDLDPDDPDGWNRLGALLLRTGALDDAIQAFKKVLALGNRARDKSVIAMATGNLGLIYEMRCDLDKAEEHFRKALALYDELGNKEGMANVYCNLGNIYQTRGDRDKSEEHHKQALAFHKELDSKGGMASDYGNLGAIYQKRGDLDEAEKYHRKALALHEKLGSKEGMANAYGNLGVIYGMRGDLDKAEEYCRKALALNKELGRKEGMANVYGNLGIIYQTRGDLDKAEEHYKKALALHEGLDNEGGMANHLGNLGIIYEMRGDKEQACEYYAKALAMSRDIGMAPEVNIIIENMKKAGCPLPE